MIEMFRRRVVVSAVALAVVALPLALAACGAASHSTTTMPSTAGANSDWPSFGNSQLDARYSTLSQVTTSNVNNLGIASATAGSQSVPRSVPGHRQAGIRRMLSAS